MDGSDLPQWPSRPLHIVLATTGSVASIKAPLIAKEFLQYDNVRVQVVATTSSLAFYNREQLEGETGVRVFQDQDEWSSWGDRSDPILHIELRRWADVILIAPCSANTLAKLAGGICDNLLTSLLRAVDFKQTQIYLFPSMNTHMYTHPFTNKHLGIVQDELGYHVYGPIQKGLACGDLGIGAMYEWSDIVQLVVNSYKLTKR